MNSTFIHILKLRPLHQMQFFSMWIIHMIKKNSGTADRAWVFSHRLRISCCEKSVTILDRGRCLWTHQPITMIVRNRHHVCLSQQRQPQMAVELIIAVFQHRVVSDKQDTNSTARTVPYPEMRPELLCEFIFFLSQICVFLIQIFCMSIIITHPVCKGLWAIHSCSALSPPRAMCLSVLHWV